MVIILEDPTRHILSNSDKIKTVIKSFGYEVIDLVGNIEIYKDSKLQGILHHWDTIFIYIYGTVEEFMPLATELEMKGFNVTIMY